MMKNRRERRIENRKGKQKVVLVSTFAGSDLMMLGFKLTGMHPAYAVEWNKHASHIHACNFEDGDGEPMIRWKKISKEEMVKLTTKIVVAEEDKNDPEKAQEALDKEKERKANFTNQIIRLSNGTGRRSETIEEADGKKIREICEQQYGKDCIIVFIGGPSCQDLSKLNHGEDKGRTGLIFEYLRVMEQLDPDISIMEEAAELADKANLELYYDFLRKVEKCGYNVGYKVVNALHYDGCQSRKRCVTMMVKKSLDKMPVFPKAMPEKAKRAGEMFDIDYFFSGHFTDRIKTGKYFFCTVTSGSPTDFMKGDKKWTPTIADKLTIQGVKPEHNYLFPTSIPDYQQRLAVGNAVPVNLAYYLGKTVMEEILGISVENEY